MRLKEKAFVQKHLLPVIPTKLYEIERKKLRSINNYPTIQVKVIKMKVLVFFLLQIGGWICSDFK